VIANPPLSDLADLLVEVILHGTEADICPCLNEHIEEGEEEAEEHPGVNYFDPYICAHMKWQ
jgi:hypothetical protein